jgi:AraC-like DNA-binding protein
MAGTVEFEFPCAGLAPFVRHYWRSAGNALNRHEILPDGCVDLVFEVHAGHARAWFYGTSTRRSEVAVRPGADYFAVGFRAAQARHFVALPMHVLTDNRAPFVEVASVCDRELVERIASEASSRNVERALLAWLSRRAPGESAVDHALRLIHASAQSLPTVKSLAAETGIGVRQLERLFLSQLGVAPKRYLRILRGSRAARALSASLDDDCAGIAAASGYADQSHMNRELQAMFGRTPRALRSADVAFVQDRQ